MNTTQGRHREMKIQDYQDKWTEIRDEACTLSGSEDCAMYFAGIGRNTQAQREWLQRYNEVGFAKVVEELVADFNEVFEEVEL